MPRQHFKARVPGEHLNRLEIHPALHEQIEIVGGQTSNVGSPDNWIEPISS